MDFLELFLDDIKIELLEDENVLLNIVQMIDNFCIVEEFFLEYFYQDEFRYDVRSFLEMLNEDDFLIILLLVKGCFEFKVFF